MVFDGSLKLERGHKPHGVNIRTGKTGDPDSNEFSAAFLKLGLPLECGLNFPLHLLILKADSRLKVGVNGKAVLPDPHSAEKN